MISAIIHENIEGQNRNPEHYENKNGCNNQSLINFTIIAVLLADLLASYCPLRPEA
jgi:hypothetical protein